MSASQSPQYSLVPPYNQSYATEIDVGRKFGNDSLFTASTVPNITQVRDIIVMKDAWIDNAFGRDFRFHQVTEYFDAMGVGRRAGQIYLKSPLLSVERCEYRQEGGDPGGQRDAWIPGVQGSSAEAAGVLVGPKANTAADYYYVYPEKAMVWWGRLRYSLAQKYRVTYSYGYPSAPDWVRDLSRTLAAREVTTTFAGKFMPPEPLANYDARFAEDIQLLMTMGGHKPLASSA